MTKKKFIICNVAGVFIVASAYPVSYWVLRQEWAWLYLPPRIQSWIGGRSGHSPEPVAYETVYKPLISTERWVDENRLRKEVVGSWTGDYRMGTIEVRVIDVNFERCSFEIHQNGDFITSLEFEESYKNLRDTHLTSNPMKTTERFQDREGNSLTVNWGEKPSVRLTFKTGLRSDASRDGWAMDSNYLRISGLNLSRYVPNKTQHHKSDRAGGSEA